MTLSQFKEDVDRQLPVGEEIFLDHVGHFVSDPDAAGEALARAGFQPAPRSIQVNPDGRGGETLTGTGNATAMFRRGYVEILFKTADTPLGRELDTALARYPGVHLAAFAVSDAMAAHDRLEKAGFRVRPLANMRRPVDTAGGQEYAAFTVARVEPNEMAEGRIQMLTHWTEAAVWQPRWMAHPNGATGLVDVVIATSDLVEAADRFSRFLDRRASLNTAGRMIRVERGGVQLISPQVLLQLAPELTIPSLPFIALYAVVVRSLDVLESVLRAGDVTFVRRGACTFARFPSGLGIGAWVFVENPAHLPWR